MAPSTDQEQWDESSERRLGRWERWVTGLHGNRFIEWDAEAHNAWLGKWAPPCPAGNPLRLQHADGFRERNLGELELRVPLTHGDHGACQVIVDEHEDEIYIRVLVCYDEDANTEATHPRHYTVCPVRTWLERPLGERAVIDVDTDEELPLYIPDYLDNVPQPNAGYHRVNRRKRNPLAQVTRDTPATASAE
jgi:hypothetical protein